MPPIKPLTLAMHRMGRLADLIGELPVNAIPEMPGTARSTEEAARLFEARYDQLRRELSEGGQLPLPVFINACVDEIDEQVRVDFALALQKAVAADGDFLADLEGALEMSGTERIQALNDKLSEILHDAIDHLVALDPRAEAFFHLMDGIYACGSDESLHCFEVDEESIPQLKTFVAWAHEHLAEVATEASAPTPAA